MIDLNTQMAGRFKIEAFKAKVNSDGELVEMPGSRHVKADWFDNIITDQGLNRIGTSSPLSSISYCHVGTGNAAPAATDTALANFLAASNTVEDDTSGAQAGSAPYYVYRQRTIRFSAGAAAGNLAEVGMGWASSGTVLFSRALILDGGGSATTITVQSDEYLDVTYEIRIYPPSGDATGTITLDGEVYDYTARACEVDAYTQFSGWSLDDKANAKSPYTYSHTAYDGNIGTVLQSPSGSSASVGSVSDVTENAYSDSSLQASVSATWGINYGNLGSGIRSVRFKVGWTFWQIEFSAQSDSSTIPKDNTKSLTLTVTHSWARKTL